MTTSKAASKAAAAALPHTETRHTAEGSIDQNGAVTTAPLAEEGVFSVWQLLEHPFGEQAHHVETSEEHSKKERTTSPSRGQRATGPSPPLDPHSQAIEALRGAAARANLMAKEAGDAAAYCWATSQRAEVAVAQVAAGLERFKAGEYKCVEVDADKEYTAQETEKECRTDWRNWCLECASKANMPSFATTGPSWPPGPAQWES